MMNEFQTLTREHVDFNDLDSFLDNHEFRFSNDNKKWQVKEFLMFKDTDEDEPLIYIDGDDYDEYIYCQFRKVTPH